MRCHSETTALNRIYEQEAYRYPDAAPYLLYEQVAPSMRRWRREVQPPVPTTLNEYGLALAHHQRYNSMYLATVEAGGGTAVILTSREFGRCLRESTTVIVDGTFATRPASPQSGQILTIHGVIRGHFYHPVIVLMTNRQSRLYNLVLQRVWTAVGEARPHHIITDYEPGLQASLESVTGVAVSGCFFHYVQALLRRARQEGIRVPFNSPGWLLVQLYGALALLPPAQVPAALAEIRGIATQHGLPYNPNFHEYFLAQWMLRVTPERFSVHGRPHRTSNVAESFHAALLRSLGPSPNIWEFTEVVAQKLNVTQARHDALGRGQERRRNIARQYLSRDQGRQTREADLLLGRITLREFLWASAMHLDAAVVEVQDVPQVGAEVVLDDIEAEDEVALEPEMEVHELPFPPPVQPRPLSPRVQLDLGAEVEVVLEPEVEVREVPLLVPELPRPPSPRVAHPEPQLPAHAIVCPVCVENLPTLLIVGCGHILCADCRERLNRCPTCRHIIVDTHRIYFP